MSITVEGATCEGTFINDKITEGDKQATLSGLPVLNIQDILEEQPEQQQQIQLLMQRYSNRLREQYYYYSNLGNDNVDESLYLTSTQFCQLMKDCEVASAECSLGNLVHTTASSNT